MDATGYTGVLLAGPPGCGKREAAFALTMLSRTFAAYPALTTARDPVLAAEKTTARQLAELRAWAQVIHEVRRDGEPYVFDRERLNRIREQGRTPVACIDDAATLAALERESDGWLAVLLWRPHDDAGGRWRRGRAPEQLTRDPLRYTLMIRTDRTDALQVAQLVRLLTRGGPPEDDGATAA